MKTDKILHLVQQKKAMRSGGALPLPKAQTGIPDVQSLLNEYKNVQEKVNQGYQDDYVTKLRKVADKAVKEGFVLENTDIVPKNILNSPGSNYCIGTSCYLANQAGDPFSFYSNALAQDYARDNPKSTRYLEQDEKYIEPGDIIQYKSPDEKGPPYHAYTVLDIGNSNQQGYKPIRVAGSTGTGPVIYANYYLGPDNKIYKNENAEPLPTQLLKRRQSGRSGFNEIVKRRNELKSQLDAINPEILNPKPTVRSNNVLPTEFMFNRSGWYGGDPTTVNYEGGDNVYALEPTATNRFADQIFTKESKLPEILQNISDINFKENFMKRYNIRSDEYDAIAKTMLGIYGAESKFGTDYWGSGKLPEPQGLSKLLGIGSVGPFQINRRNLSKDLRERYSNEDLHDPQKAAQATMEFLAEGMTGKGMNLRARAKKTEDSPMYMRNVDPSNYLEYLPYLHNDPSWLTGDKSTMQSKNDVVAGEHPYKQLVDYYSGLFDVLPSSISTPVEITGERISKKRGGLAKAQYGLPVNNPHLPNTPLATGAAESVMGPIDYFLLPSQLPLKAATALGRGAITLAEILNPLGGFRPSTDMLYRGIGKEGFEDAMESGVLRAAQHNYPAKRSITEIVNSPKQFDKVYYSPDAEAAMRYGQGYVAAVPKTAADFVNRYKGKGKDWSQLTSRQIPIEEATIFQKYPIVGYKKKFKFQDAGESGLPKKNPHLPNTTLATGAATPTMSPIEVAISAMTGAGLAPSAVKLSKSILNAEPEHRRWMLNSIPFWEAYIANNIRETYEKARDMYENANKKQTGGEESGLQYVPSGTYGRYYDPEAKEYIPEVYLPDVEISASKDLPFQNNKFAPFLAARGTADYVPLETAFLPGTPIVKGLGKVGNVLLDAVNPLAGMRNLKSSIPDYTPGPAYVEALERLNQTRAKYLDELNKLQESPQVGKSLGDITADIDALSASIKPRSEATTGDLQNMLDQLRSINANLEQHVPLHRRAFTSSDISEQLARQAQDPGDMPGTGVSDVGEAMSMQDRIKNFEDIQRQEGIGPLAKYLGRTPQGARFEFVPEKYMIEAKGLTGKGTTVKPEDFYTTSELQKKIDQLAAYNRAQSQFDEMNPLTGADMVMSALSGDKSRDELFQTLFPNVSIPSFNEKIINPEHMMQLRESLKYMPSQYFQDPLNPKRGLKFDLQNKMKEDSMPKSLADYLSQKSTTWHKEDPLGYAREMMGVNKTEGLSMDEIRRLAESKQNELTDWYRQRLLQDFNKPFTAGDAVRLGLNPNKMGGLTSSKAKEILHDKSVHGHPLTDKQRKFFGAIASGKSYKVRVKKNKQ